MTGQATFSGGVFADSVDGGRAGADIELSERGILAHTPDGDDFLIPYRECHIEVGGFSGRMVFCRNEDRSVTIFCEARPFPNALSQASLGILEDQLAQQFQLRRGESRRGFWIGTAVLLLIACMVVGGYWAIRAGARAAIRNLPMAIDEQIGAAVFESIDLGGPALDDPVVVGAIQTMVDRLAPHAARQDVEFTVHVVDSPVTNAFALPGGTIVVYTGLIAAADDADQVAGVLGHEMAHVTMRHGLERVAQAAGLGTAIHLLLGDAQGMIATSAELFQLASINSYSRAQEDAADSEGVRMLHAAQIDPAALARFFDRLREEHGDVPGVMSWMSTHPAHQDRVDRIHTQLAALPEQSYEPVAVDWPEVQIRVNQDNH